MKSLRAVSLDLDDTLWDLRPVLLRAEQRMLEWLATNCPRVRSDCEPAAMRALRDQVMAEHPAMAHDLTFVRRQVLERCIVGAGYAPELVDDAFEAFMIERNAVTLFDDALELLQRLQGRYLVLALTNGNADLERIGVAQYFDHLVNAADAGASKPHRAMFDRALELSGVDAGDIVHVGDDPVSDVGGAHAAGWHSIWFNPRGASWAHDGFAPVAEVRSLRQLQALLAP